MMAPPPPALEIVTLGAADAPAYNALLRQAVLAHPDSLRIAEADIVAHPFDTTPGADRACLVARNGTEPWLGTVAVEREQGRAKRTHIAWLVRMYVPLEFAGRGIGGHLLDAAIARARALPGVGKLNLTVAAHNLRALELYQRRGFVEFAREPDAFRDPAPRTELSLSLSW